MNEEKKKYIERLHALEAQRESWLDQWREIGEYILPRRIMFVTDGQQPNRGESRQSRIIDSTASRAIRMLAAGMQGGLTSPARPWFRLRLTDSDLMEWSPVREYLNVIEREIYRILAGSNFYSAVHTVYTDLAGFATAVLYEEEDFDSLVRFKVVSPGEYCLAEGSQGLVDTVYRRFWMTSRQMHQRWGDRVSQRIRDSLDRNPFQWHQVVHSVQPNPNKNEKESDRESKAWESVYLEYAGDGKILARSGYDENPFMCPRWGTSGSDSYGRGPGDDVLPDVKTLQDMQRSVLKALHKMVDPPMRVPSGFKGRLSLIPGSVTMVDPNAPESAIGPLYKVSVDIASAEQKIAAVQAAIRDGFFNDLFLMIQSRPNMTATEVAERHEEKLLILGPVIERQFSELLNPLLDRTWSILFRNSRHRLPPPPREAVGADLKVEYISLLAQAQKMIGTESLGRVTDYVGNLSRIRPDVLDKVDLDEAVDQFAEMMGAPPKVIRSDDLVAEIRQTRMQKEQEVTARQQAAAALSQGGSLAQPGEKLGGEAPGNKNIGEMLSRLISSQGPAMGGRS